VTELTLRSSGLRGRLNLKGFVNLKELDCSNNKIDSLDLSDCENLERLTCYRNLLHETSFLENLKNPDKLVFLDIADNRFGKEQDLSFLEKLVNLEEVDLSNKNKQTVESGIYNQFGGSLEKLQNLTKLKSLRINGTDINSGIEYLPDSLKEIY